MLDQSAYTTAECSEMVIVMREWVVAYVELQQKINQKQDTGSAREKYLKKQSEYESRVPLVIKDTLRNTLNDLEKVLRNKS